MSLLVVSKIKTNSIVWWKNFPPFSMNKSSIKWLMLFIKFGKRKVSLKDKINHKNKMMLSFNVSTVFGVMRMRKLQRFNIHHLLMNSKLMMMWFKALINVVMKSPRSFTLTINWNSWTWENVENKFQTILMLPHSSLDSSNH